LLSRLKQWWPSKPVGLNGLNLQSPLTCIPPASHPFLFTWAATLWNAVSPWAATPSASHPRSVDAYTPWPSCPCLSWMLLLASQQLVSLHSIKGAGHRSRLAACAVCPVGTRSRFLYIVKCAHCSRDLTVKTLGVWLRLRNFHLN